MNRLYKLLDRPAWEAALAEGLLQGSAVDLADGFIHFSTAAQAHETARLHFAGQDDLVLLTVDASGLGEALHWEPSRGGELFPHLYAPLPTSAVTAVKELTLDSRGVPDLGVLRP